MLFGHQRADNGPIYVKKLSVPALTPMSISARLEVDWSRNFYYISLKRSFTDDRQTDNGVFRAARGFCQVKKIQEKL